MLGHSNLKSIMLEFIFIFKSNKINSYVMNIFVYSSSMSKMND